MSDEEQPNLFWVDVETTGLRDNDEPLEVGVVITDGDLQPLAAFHAFVAHDLGELRMSQWAWQTHMSNGLFAELVERAEHYPAVLSTDVDAGPFGRLSGLGLERGLLRKARLSEELCEFIRRYAYGAPFAGSTVDFDRRVMSLHFPDVVDLLHYRKVDVSTFRETIRRWRTDLELPPKSDRHRVFDDLAASIEVGRMTRSLLLGELPPPNHVEIPILTTPDDVVSEWHLREEPASGGRKLHDFLGWTWDEYARWVETTEAPVYVPDR